MNSAGSLELSDAHFATAEAVLGQHVPREALLAPITADPTRNSIFHAAPVLALQAIEHELGHDIADPDAFLRRPLTPNQQVHMQQHPVIGMLASRLAMANEVYRPTRSLALPPMADVGTTRARIQDGITDKLREHVLTLPSNWSFTPELSLFDDLSDGFAAIASTAIGKTTLIARLLRMSGVGTMRMLGGERRPILAVVTLPTQRLTDQFAGKTGDMTFLDFLGPGIKVTQFFGKKHDASGDVVLTTPNSAGRLDLSKRDIVCGDEGHNSMAPRYEEIKAALTGRLFLFTATKAYDKNRDLSAKYRHIEVNNRVDLIRQGVLNNTRLLQFEYAEDPLPLVAQLAAEYIKNGRRVIAYCRRLGRGETERRSEILAKWVNELCGREVAVSIGSHNKDSDDAERRYTEGGLRMLTNTKVIREGRNLPADVGMHGDAPQWVLEQETGRIGRLSTFMSEVLQFSRKGSKGARLHHVYGLEHFGREMILLSDSVRFGDGPLPGMPVRNNTNDASPKDERGTPLLLPIEAFPKELQEQLAKIKPVRTVTIGGRDFEIEPGPGQTASSEIANRYKAPLVWLHAQFDKAKIPYEGVVLNVDGQERYERLYAAEAEEFLENHPMPELLKSITMNEGEIASLYKVSHGFVRTVVVSMGLGPRQAGGYRSATLTFGAEVLFAVEHAVNALPLADKSDAPLQAAILEYSPWFVRWYLDKYQVRPAEKRRNHQGEYAGACLHFTVGQISELRKVYQNIPEPTEADMGLHKIAVEAAMALAALQRELTPEEEASIYPRQTSGEKRPAAYIPRSMGEAILARMQPEKLPAYLIPNTVIIYRSHLQGPCRGALRTGRLKTARPIEHIRLVKGKTFTCSSWETLRLAEEKFGRHPEAEPIDYDKLPTGPDDADPERWAYAQSIQEKYVAREVLQPLPQQIPQQEELDPEVLFAEAIGDRATNEAEGITSVVKDTKKDALLDASTGLGSEPPIPPRPDSHPASAEPVVASQEALQPRRFVIDGIPVATRPIKENPHRQEAHKTMSGGFAVPRGYVDMLDYLSSQGIECELVALRFIVRSQGYDASTRFDAHTKKLWAADMTALKTEERIRQMPIAPDGAVTPRQLSEEFRQFGLEEGHIRHITNVLGQSLLEKGQLFARERSAGGQPGRFALHYRGDYADKIRKQISTLAMRRQIGILKRYGHFTPVW